MVGIEFKVKRKVWLEYKGRPLLGEGRYRLLRHILATRSLKKSATSLGISYKTAYNYIQRIEQRLKKSVIITHKGGPEAGGYTELTDLGRALMKRYEEAAR